MMNWSMRWQCSGRKSVSQAKCYRRASTSALFWETQFHLLRGSIELVLNNLALTAVMETEMRNISGNVICLKHFGLNSQIILKCIRKALTEINSPHH